jgi:hypothetical protein
LNAWTHDGCARRSEPRTLQREPLREDEGVIALIQLRRALKGQVRHEEVQRADRLPFNGTVE